LIRAATPRDASAIARVQGRAWRHGYQLIVDPARLEAMGGPEQEAAWRGALEDGMRAWVYDQDGTLAGFAAAGPARDGDLPPSAGELYTLYVDPVAQGAGVGTALLRHAVDELRAAGFAEAVLWTFAANELGRRFYTGAGWRVDGEAVQRERDEAPVIRYRREL
jgi:ribosomal protein S18 acetylase RimI-like enzyme